MPLQATSGAASQDAFGVYGVAVVPTYIEDVMSTYLYNGTDTSTSHRIVNGIDLAGKGGLVWIKKRDSNIANTSHYLSDTVRGNNYLASNSTNAEAAGDIASYNSDGWTFNASTGLGTDYLAAQSYASWTFRKQPKFFDVVTWTGTGANRTVAHNLGSVPGCIIVKRTDRSGDNWKIYHRSTTATKFFNFTTAAAATDASYWNNTEPTSTVFTVGTDSSVNGSGGSFVAYLFAHDAGGFGLTGSDNVISCGSYTGNGSASGPVVTLGYEPQWVVWKAASSGTESWHIRDVMRGMPVTASGKDLYADSSSAEGSTTNEGLIPTATGLQVIGTNTNANANGVTYIYIAIRRGPMKVPTTGTSVFAPVSLTPSGATNVTTNFPSDMLITTDRAKAYDINTFNFSRLVGSSQTSGNYLRTNTTAAEVAGNYGMGFDNQTKIVDNYMNTFNAIAEPVIYWNFKRAPSFFDEVCYTGTGSARTVSHNLAAVPELIIVKRRNLAAGGVVYTASSGTGFYLRLFETGGDNGNTSTTGALWNNTTPTSSVFSLGTSNQVNGNTNTYVAYLFSTCAGVSKVGSYTGTGSTQTINCGFTGGARFVLIKKSTSTAPDRDWYVWDTARGMVSGTDPSLKLNTTAAEVNANDVYTITTGFQLVSSSDYVNASGVTYIFLAIA